LVRNRSPRVGVTKPTAIAIHTTEGHNYPGFKDMDGLFNWFNSPSSDASSHVAIDAEGHAYRFVPDEQKAWTILDLNSCTLNIELVGFAADSGQTWRKRWAQIIKCAKYCAYWSKKYDIDLHRGKVRSRSFATGVIAHSDLTKFGVGSHTDPGPAFPWKRMLALARGFKATGWV